MELTGKLVVVSGASSGIGAATARLVAARGACVVMLARRQSALDVVAQEIRKTGGTAHVYPVDLGDIDAVARVTAAIQNEVGVPDVVVNNAGLGRWLSMEETDPHEALQMTMVPYMGAFALTRGFIEGMVRRGSGRIINITSPAAFTPFPGAVAYSVARAAMRNFTTALHVDLGGTGVTTALVVCGEVASDYFDNNPGSHERIPGIGRFFPTLTPERAADAIVRAAEGTQRRLVVPVLLRWTLWLWFVAPWLVQGLVNVTGYRRRKD